jgi:hypothetical protein
MLVSSHAIALANSGQDAGTGGGTERSSNESATGELLEAIVKDANIGEFLVIGVKVPYSTCSLPSSSLFRRLSVFAWLDLRMQANELVFCFLV